MRSITCAVCDGNALAWVAAYLPRGENIRRTEKKKEEEEGTTTFNL